MMNNIGKFGQDLVRSIACEMERGPNQSGNVQFVGTAKFCKLKTMINIYGSIYDNIYDYTTRNYQLTIKRDEITHLLWIICPGCTEKIYTQRVSEDAAFVDHSWFKVECDYCKDYNISVHCSCREQPSLEEIRTKELTCPRCERVMVEK